MKLKLILAIALASASLARLAALDVYPIDRASILAGAFFDFKVELDGPRNPGDVKIQINGANYSIALGAKAEFIAQEAGLATPASAFIARRVKIAKAGEYKVRIQDGDAVKNLTWTVFPSATVAQAKNVIFLLADGLSIGHRTAARIMAKGNTEGSSNGLLAMDTMERMGLIGTSSVDSIAVDSANSMSAYMTGQKSSINAMGVYADRTPDPFDDPRQETIAELVRRTTKKSIGIVSDAELEDATPAAVLAHTRKRDEKAGIVKFFLDAKPEVLLGGGSAYFLPKATQGSSRRDETNYVDLFQKAGYSLATDRYELATAMEGKPSRLLGLFHLGNLDGYMDRFVVGKGSVAQFPFQPDLTEMAQAALGVLSTNKEGFFLMVEAGLVDKYSHPMDWERAVYDTIMFDKVIQIAKDFAARNPGTLIVVTGDHTHSISVYGTVDDDKPGATMRDKVGTYAAAGFPNYQDADGNGYPDTPAVSRRLAVGFGNHPDYWENFQPKLEGVFSPTVKDSAGRYVANEKYRSETATLIAGNLSYADSTEVHSVDDQILQMSGPGSEKIKAYQENTAVFRYLVEALGLKP